MTIQYILEATEPIALYTVTTRKGGFLDGNHEGGIMKDHRPPPTTRTTPYILGRIRHFRALVYVDPGFARRQLALVMVQAQRHLRPRQLSQFVLAKTARHS